MSEQIENAPAPTPRNPSILDINTEVRELISKSFPDVRQQVVDKLVREEVNKRAEKLEKLVLTFVGAKRTYDKQEPDIVTMNSDGSQNKTWSKAVWEKRLKAKQAIESAEKAFKKVLEEGDYGQVDKAIQQLTSGEVKE